jgi:trehalose 6-phosphate phosphatase
MADGGTRVLIVSGRRAAEIVPLLSLARHPEIWGGHGFERLLPDGELRMREASGAQKELLKQAVNAVAEPVRGGARIERKPASIALHWRGLPALAVARIQEQAHAAWSPLGRGGQFDLLAFDGGLELRSRDCNKEHAVRAILSETAEGSAVAYLGDDLTDEDAFAAVKPRGIAVLVRPRCRETLADVWIRPPRELLAFLSRWRTQGGNT